MASRFLDSDHPHPPKHPRDDDDLPNPTSPPVKAKKVDSSTSDSDSAASGTTYTAVDESGRHTDTSDSQPTSLETIDMETFLQILDLDEDDSHDFSKGMAWAYFSQAGSTFEEMDTAFEEKNLPKLSSLGHFLKGSSAALGVAKVQASCEKIQHYGQLRDEEANLDLTDKEALDKIQPLLGKVKIEYQVAEKWLRNWYSENATGGDPVLE